jgi:mono/diheme cytochrome c family protein
MRLVLRILLYLVLAVVVLGGGFVAFISIRGVPHYDPPKIDLKVESTPARVARGKKIASILCSGCHRNPTSQLLTGRAMIEAPEFGKMYSRNLTKHPTKGIGGWADGDIYRIIRTGIKKDGGFVPPMSGLSRIADEDVYSIISFLRSDDPWVAAQDVTDSVSDYSFFAKFLCLVAFSPAELPKTTIAVPDSTDKLALGRYLARDMAQCQDCHSADFSKLDMKVPEKSVDFFAGGTEMIDLVGKKIHTKNITSDEETGIGRWTEAEFSRAVREGFRKDNSLLQSPMERFPEFSDYEIGAIYAYLRTVPRIHKRNLPDDTYHPSAASASKGEEIYVKYKCFACHGQEGLGLCDLRQAFRKYGTNDSLTTWIRDPSKIVPGSKMPTWNGVIQEGEYGALCDYVRTLGERAQRLASK